MKDEGYPMREMVNLNCIWHRMIEKRMSDLGLTSIQSRMLGYVYFQRRQEKKVFQRELEEEFKIRKSSVTSVIQILEKKRAGPQDRRPRRRPEKGTGADRTGNRSSGNRAGTAEPPGGHGKPGAWRRGTKTLVFMYP